MVYKSLRRVFPVGPEVVIQALFPVYRHCVSDWIGLIYSGFGSSGAQTVFHGHRNVDINFCLDFYFRFGFYLWLGLQFRYYGGTSTSPCSWHEDHGGGRFWATYVDRTQSLRASACVSWPPERNPTHQQDLCDLRYSLERFPWISWNYSTKMTLSNRLNSQIHHYLRLIIVLRPIDNIIKQSRYRVY